MKSNTFVLAVASLLSAAIAFPAMDAAQLLKYNEYAKKNAEGCPYAASAEAQRRGEECPFAKTKRATFDKMAQAIRTDGEYAFVPPNFEAGDQRGGFLDEVDFNPVTNTTQAPARASMLLQTTDTYPTTV